MGASLTSPQTRDRTMRDIGLADRLRARGLKVVEVDGWKDRGSSTFTPKGAVNHHTAGAARGNAPSLGICINGRSDLPGPLCHVLLARDDTCYVIAAGRANHAGRGGWQGLTGNSSVHGLEVEHVGTSAEPMPASKIAVMVQIHAAFLEGSSRTASLVCNHREWTPRKIDCYGIDGQQLRPYTASALAAPQQEEDDMYSDKDRDRDNAVAVKVEVLWKDYGKGDGWTGPMREVVKKTRDLVTALAKKAGI